MLRDEPYTELPEIITSFAQDSNSVSLQATFGSVAQIAAIVFNLDTTYAFSPDDIRLELSYEGRVDEVQLTLEHNATVDSGCSYYLQSSDAIEWYVSSWISCWGEFEGYTAPTAVSSITVRVGSLGTSGSAAFAVQTFRFTP